ncbi:MAG: hypothetical protein WCO25_05440 [Candidatus Uhrbacteria bacterium]
MEPSEIQVEIQNELSDLLARWTRLVARAEENGMRIGFLPIAAPSGIPRLEPPVAVAEVLPPSLPAETVPVEPIAARGEASCVIVSYPDRGTGPSLAERAGWHDALRDGLPVLRHPPEAMEDEASDLFEFVRDERRLGMFPPGIQVLLLQYVVARTRFRQAHGLDDRLAAPIISAVGKYAARTQIGYVYGAKRDHGPLGGTWKHDAQAYLNELSDVAAESADGSVTPGRLIRLLELSVENAEPSEDVFDSLDVAIRGGVSQSDSRVVRILEPFLSDLDATGQYKTLRGAIRAAGRKSQAVAVIAEESAPVLAGWPWLAFTRGKLAVMVGGDPREPNRVRIQDAFGFAELAWDPSADRSNLLAQVRDRVACGKVDLVIILRRFIGHDVDNVVLPACRAASVPWVSVPTGYGISRIRQEIERMVARPQ